MDAKRGDIGSTMAAYAAAFLRPGRAAVLGRASPSRPYLGFGSLRPARRRWPRESGAGLFVLALTSNPEGAEVQRAVRGGRPDRRRDDAGPPGRRERGGASRWAPSARSSARRSGDLSSCDLASTARCWPPASAPRGRPRRTCPAVFGAAVRNVVPNVSRGVLRHGPDVGALRDAAERFADEIRAAVASA